MPNCDFYAAGADFTDILSFAFERLPCRVFQSYSEFGQELREYTSLEELASFEPIGRPVGTVYSVLLQLWPVEASENVQVRRIGLNPAKCGGHTFRYSIDGWGLIQLYLGGFGPQGLVHSHTNHNSEARARKWCSPEDPLGPAESWQWNVVTSVSRKLNQHIRSHLAVSKLAARPVLPEASTLIEQGYPTI